MSIPQWLQITQLPMDNITYSMLLVSVNDPDDHTLIEKIAGELKTETGVDPAILYKVRESTADIRQIINLIFLGAISIMMFLAFFSLSASMSSNLYD